MSDEPSDQQKIEHFLNSVGQSLDQILNGTEVVQDTSKRRNGFALLIFPFTGNDGRCNYIGNGVARDEVITVLRAQAERLERKESE